MHDWEMHDWRVPAALTCLYLLSLPSLRWVGQHVPNAKSMLQECMVLYNFGQVVLNGWTVWVIVDALLNKNHPLVGGVTETTCTFAVWVHYCDKYLEFADTWFMLLRGNHRQVTFLHVYHHTTIAWAWWAGMSLYATGDSYFGALLNSAIHVLMYGYYTMALVGVKCPWKKYLTMAQLAQFASVMLFTAVCFYTNYHKGQLERNHVLACVIQVGEMASLFVLFFGFYNKSYSKDKDDDNAGKKKKNDDLTVEVKDECSKAIESTVKSAGEGEIQDECAAAIGAMVAPVRNATSKLASSVTKDHSPLAKATQRPTWGLGS
jgi:elongation of very long chain fatty acids protein 4